MVLISSSLLCCHPITFLLIEITSGCANPQGWFTTVTIRKPVKASTTNVGARVYRQKVAKNALRRSEPLKCKKKKKSSDLLQPSLLSPHHTHHWLRLQVVMPAFRRGLLLSQSGSQSKAMKQTKVGASVYRQEVTKIGWRRSESLKCKMYIKNGGSDYLLPILLSPHHMHHWLRSQVVMPTFRRGPSLSPSGRQSKASNYNQSWSKCIQYRKWLKRRKKKTK